MSTTSKKLYIHIGFGKTGTTFLQSFFKNNKIENLYYPECKKNDYERHIHLTSSINKIFPFKHWEKTFEEIDQVHKTKNINNVLISSEEFIFDKLFVANFHFIKELFKDYTIKIVITLDNVFNNIYKSYLEFIKKYQNEYVLNNIEDFIKLHRRSFDFKYKIEDFEELVSYENVIIIPYTKDNYLEKFVNALGLLTNDNQKQLEVYSKNIFNKSFSILYTDFLEYLYSIKLPKQKYLNIVKNLDKIDQKHLQSYDQMKNILQISINQEQYNIIKSKLDFLKNEQYRKYKEQYKIYKIMKYCDTHYPIIRMNFNYIIDKYNFNHNDFYKCFYEHLFHKYYLNIRSPEEEIKYDIMQYSKFDTNNKNYCHIHCYNIDKFNYMFSKYKINLEKYFNIIITYSIGNYTPECNDSLIMKVKNRGADFGGKLCALDYLYKNKIQYQNILFLHSKTNDKKREEYFTPLIGSEETIKNNLNKLNNYNALFNNLHSIHNRKNFETMYMSNSYYHNELLNYLKVSNKKEESYCEGNCLFLSHKIVDFIFKNNMNIFYNALNTIEDFDVSWVKGRYNKHNVSIETLYEHFKYNVNYMNLNKNNKAVGNNFANKSNDMPDGMFEHIFERIYVNVIKHLNLSYLLV